MTPSRGRRLALLAALLGWMFDGMEMGLFPLVARSALSDLMPNTDESAISRWFGIVTASFLIGAATGGVLFGWLGDKIGRVKAMTLSVLLYSLCSGASAFAAEPWHIAALRFLGALGMGGEWALGVALVMELWPDGSRAWLAAGIGACGNLGYTICGLVSLGLNHSGGHVHETLTSLGCSPATIDLLTRGHYWRMLMFVGAVPALLTLFIRLFVPESDKWQAETRTGRTSGWSGQDLSVVAVGVAIAGGMIALGMSDAEGWLKLFGNCAALLLITLCYLYPAWRYLQRVETSPQRRQATLQRMLLAAGLSGVPLLGTWSGVMWIYQWVGTIPGGLHPDARPQMQIASSIGAAIGCACAALLADAFNRRGMYAVLCVGSVLAMFAFYQIKSEFGLGIVAAAGGLGLVTAAFYGWLPLYLPELFPTQVRASGQGFGFNFGRILAAAGALQMPLLLKAFDHDYASTCVLPAGIYFVGLVLIAIAPETKGRPLPD